MPALTNVSPQPKSADAKIWRYMSYSKLQSLLETRSLYLRQVEKLADQHEGSMPVATKRLIDSYLPGVDPRTIKPAYYPPARNRKWYYVTCWTLRDAECDALWRLYGDEADKDECVAVESVYSSLVQPFDGGDDIAGIVSYADYETFNDPAVGDWMLLLLKRKAFEYEQEVRVIRRYIRFAPESQHVVMNPTAPDMRQEWWESLYAQPDGVFVPVDVHDLVKDVYVSPYARVDYFERVSALLTTSGLRLKPKWSSMRTPPILG